MAAPHGYDILLPSAGRSATTTSPAFEIPANARGVILAWDWTVEGGAGAESITPKIQGFDPLSGKWADLTAFTGVSAVALYFLICNSGDIAAVDVVSPSQSNTMVLTPVCRVVMTHSAGSEHTYSLSAQYCA